MSNNFQKVRKGIHLSPQSSIANPRNGDMAYDLTKETFVHYQNGAWSDLQRRVDVATAASLTSAQFTASVTEATLVKLTGATVGDIHGLMAKPDAKLLYIYNGSSAIMTLKHDSATEATAANRILNPDNVDITVFAKQTVVLSYDSAQSRWITISAPNTTSGTGITQVLFEAVIPTFLVRVATTVNGAMATAFDNGSSVDGVVLATGNIILIKNQTVPSENGVYVVQASGAPVRHTDYDTFAELNGAMVAVTEGSTNINLYYYQNATLASLSDAQVWTTTPNPQIFTVPAGVFNIMVVVCGAGGGGGGGGGTTGSGGGAHGFDNRGGGGNGGQGSIPITMWVAVTPGQDYEIIVGIGGKGGNGPTGGGAGQVGINGGFSSFGLNGVFMIRSIGGAGGDGSGGGGGSSAAAVPFGLAEPGTMLSGQGKGGNGTSTSGCSTPFGNTGLPGGDSLYAVGGIGGPPGAGRHGGGGGGAGGIGGNGGRGGSSVDLYSIEATPTGAVRLSNVVTITTTVPHNLSIGQSVQISGVADGTMNGTFLITGTPTATTFTYADVGANSNSGNGLARGAIPGGGQPGIRGSGGGGGIGAQGGANNTGGAAEQAGETNGAGGGGGNGYVELYY